MHVLQVLKFYNLEGQSKWLNLLYESCFLVLFLILAWCASPLSGCTFATSSNHLYKQSSIRKCHAPIFVILVDWVGDLA